MRVAYLYFFSSYRIDKNSLKPNSIIFDLEFNGEKLNAVADNKCVGLSKNGKILWEYDYSGRVLKNYDIAVNGSKMLLFDNGGVGEIVVVSAGGKAYDTIKTESMPEIVNIKSDYISYNSGRDVIVSKFDGKGVKRATCSADIKQAVAIEKNKVFCVYNSSIQVKKPVHQKKQDVVVITAE